VPHIIRHLAASENIPLRLVVVPAGYGSTHPDAPNDDPHGRALDQRVDVKLIVNKGLGGYVVLIVTERKDRERPGQNRQDVSVWQMLP
jgi:hypothetical protein